MAATHTPAEIGQDRVPLISDPLAEALHFMRMEGVFYCRSELTAPWGVGMPALPDCVYFHVVTAGECWLLLESGEPLHAREGDLVVVPHGNGHAAVDEIGAETPSVFDLPHEYVSPQYAILRHGGGGEPTTVMCGAVQFKHPAARSLVALLPEVIHVTSSIVRNEWQWMPALLGLMADETAMTRPGGEAVVTRLSDILVIQAIRYWIASDAASTAGWLGALNDPLIGHAIAMIHREPERDWSVGSLASEVAMSRSSFSAKFSALVGESPMQYVTRWRMHLATDLLGEERLTVSQAAERLGYTTEAAFSRAFKRVTGEAPGAVRKAGLNA